MNDMKHPRFPWREFIEDLIREDEKPNDGLLHPSTHLGCEIAMCHDMDPDIPNKPKSYAQLMRLKTGTIWHEYLERKLKNGEWDGYEFITEAPATKGLPKGWAGTRDVLVGFLGGGGQIHEVGNFHQLTDFKTVQGSGLKFLTDEPKPEHLRQTSAYYWSAVEEGYNMGPEICVVHLPLSPAPYGVQIEAVPIAQWFEPMPKAEIFGEMRRRSKVVAAYLAAKKGDYLTEFMDHDPFAPKQMPMDPFTKTDKRSGMTKEGYKPNWLVKYCDSPVCECKGQMEIVHAYHDDPIPTTGGSI